ncbi:MAG: hypothetical protein QM741_06480 [Rudaea sp.]|uniref:hypothetical protein n=1 Tax=Rudaea sp. TaxID=2136325 RepID=UPI0039E6F3FD
MNEPKAISMSGGAGLAEAIVGAALVVGETPLAERLLQHNARIFTEKWRCR